MVALLQGSEASDVTSNPPPAAINPSGSVHPREVVELDTIVVKADRLPAHAQHRAFAVSEISRERMLSSPSTRLDDLLRKELPGFSLFRRSSSRVAHPTSQGVSLRNLGPNGSGRTLVLLDGTPLNDPFAGWIPWQRVPLGSLDRIFVTRGGGAGLYGNAALAGTIQLETRRAPGRSVELYSLGGNRGTYEQSLSASWEEGPVRMSLFGHHAETDGYPIVRADQRGAVDIAAYSGTDLIQGSLIWDVEANTWLEFHAAGFTEDRGNGTLMAQNSTEALDLSGVLVGALPEWKAEVRLQAWYQNRDFASTFTSVNERRSHETPALDQYHVPAQSAGGSLTWSQLAGTSHRITGGFDVRWVAGETNERFRYLVDRFTLNREAGGEQWFAGIFLEDVWELDPGITLTAGGRLDSIRQTQGRRTERDQNSGSVLLHEKFEDQEHFQPNGRLGLNVEVNDELALRAAGYTGFRQPTLNEFYRPFRIGNEITEANAHLDPEVLRGFEAGLDWEPEEAWTIAITGFWNRLDDAVGNVTLGGGPGNFDPGGFVPAGTVLRQRQNLDRIEVKGAELSLAWKLAPDWILETQYLFSHSEVIKASQARSLEGKRLEQAPLQTVTASISWNPAERWGFTLQGRFSGRQFEDDLNTTSLGAFATVDAAVNYQANPHLSLDLRAENLLNTEYETGRSASGIVLGGTPRLVTLGVRLKF